MAGAAVSPPASPLPAPGGFGPEGLQALRLAEGGLAATRDPVVAVLDFDTAGRLDVHWPTLGRWKLLLRERSALVLGFASASEAVRELADCLARWAEAANGMPTCRAAVGLLRPGGIGVHCAVLERAAPGQLLVLGAVGLELGSEFPTTTQTPVDGPQGPMQVLEVAWSLESTAPRAGFHPPRVDERYRVEGFLGAGGMAAVWRANDSRLSRTVAIKVLHPHLGLTDGARERFRREAVICASLVHENVVQVFDASPPRWPESYMVMEFVEGESLRDYLDRLGPLPENAALLLVQQAAAALAEAHRREVTHRDVKPDNVLLSRGGRVKLSDFGLASLRELPRLTASGHMLGTPAYMAPEQIHGASAAPGQDVFALGVTLYELVTGQLPFPGTTPIEVMSRIASGRFAALREVRPVSVELEAIVSKALSFDPGQRYPDAGGLHDALMKLLEARKLAPTPAVLAQLCGARTAAEVAQAVESGSAPKLQRVVPAAAHRPDRTLPVAIAAGALLSAGVVGLVLWRRPPQPQADVGQAVVTIQPIAVPEPRPLPTPALPEPTPGEVPAPDLRTEPPRLRPGPTSPRPTRPAEPVKRPEGAAPAEPPRPPPATETAPAPAPTPMPREVVVRIRPFGLLEVDGKLATPLGEDQKRYRLTLSPGPHALRASTDGQRWKSSSLLLDGTSNPAPVDIDLASP